MIKICYFSGTGNTKKIAEILNDNLKKLGEISDTFRIENGQEILEVMPDILVIAYPIHGFNTPENVLTFARTLPQNISHVYIVKTSGEPLRLNDASSQDLIKILREKGAVVYGEYHIIMPYNIIFRHTDEMASKMLETAREKTAKIADDIVNKRFHLINPNFSARLFKKICSIEHFGMRFNGRLYNVNTRTCIKCMRCVEKCPVGNISYTNKFSFGKNCIGCMRCAFSCPTDSMHIGILDFMRVNGAYDFTKKAQSAVIPKYCNRAYTKYFNE